MKYENQILHGPAQDQLKTINSDSIDLIVTDPPYGYSFMNKDWDKAVVGVDTWNECLRVLKAGAFAFIMSSPRQDVLCKMILNLIDAGFETNFTSLYWTYASGFPKAANTTRLLEKRGISKPELDGSYLGCQFKPAVEIILVVMKPLSEKTFVDQALSNQKGITWLDQCRIPYQSDDDLEGCKPWSDKGRQGLHNFRKICESQGYDNLKKIPQMDDGPNDKGRFPANLLVEDDVLNDGKITKSVGGFSKWDKNKGLHTWNELKVREGDRKETVLPRSNKIHQFSAPVDEGSFSRYFSLDSWTEKTLPFLIVPKASKGEKEKGLDGPAIPMPHSTSMHCAKCGLRILGNPKPNCQCETKEELRQSARNFHPTVKPLKLMSYLITMGSREGDTVLDPFCGSGTVLIAARQLARDFIGCEINDEYVKIANTRLKPYLLQTRLSV